MKNRLNPRELIDLSLSRAGLMRRPSTVGVTTGLLALAGVSALVGAGVALLFAPARGEATRADLKKRARDLVGRETPNTTVQPPQWGPPVRPPMTA